MRTLTALAIGILCLLASPVLATAITSSGVLTADNAFTLYLSTDDSVAGTLVVSGYDWPSPQSFGPTALTPGVTNYLHVFATNWGGPAGFLGEFHLQGGGLQFANGTQTLLTNANFSEWKVSTEGWGIWNGSLVNEGANGVAPWGTMAGISSNAQWIWTPDGYGSPRYFSAAIMSTGDGETRPNIPEASSLMLALCGLSSIGGALRLRRK